MYAEINEQVAFVRSVWLDSIWVAQSLAQGGATGAISGTVLDPSGAVVAGAEVRIVNQDTGALTRTTKTDANGSFTAHVAARWHLHGNCPVRVLQEGKFTNIAVRVTETTRMTAKLRHPGGAGED